MMKCLKGRVCRRRIKGQQWHVSFFSPSPPPTSLFHFRLPFRLSLHFILHANSTALFLRPGLFLVLLPYPVHHSRQFAAMAQQTSQNEPLLLRFPEEVRHNIYSFLNLKRDDAMSLYNHGSGCECFECEQGPIEKQLFLVSRSISEDARKYFYSINAFFTPAASLEYMSAFGKLTPVALRSLREVRLSIRIPDIVDSSGKLIGHPQDRRPFNEYKKVMAVWRKFCRGLAREAEPNTLDLNLHIWAADGERAKLALTPLRQCPLFRHLAIGLPCLNDPSLQTFVRNLVLGYIGRPESPFRFGDLPTEIELMILERAGAIGPKELKWHGQRHTFFEDRCVSGHCEGWPNGGCSLRTVTFSSKGNCFKMPKALLQASQSTKWETERLVYSRSCFSVQIEWPYRRPRTSTWPINDSVFLVPIPAHCVQHLRCFRWAFRMELDETSFRPGRPETEDLKKGVEYLAQNALLSELTLILDFSHEDAIMQRSSKIVRTLGACWPDEENATEIKTDLYRRVIEIVSSLKGLKNCIVRLSWPLQDLQPRITKEKLLERIVMGSDYDSSASRKEWGYEAISSWYSWERW